MKGQEQKEIEKGTGGKFKKFPLGILLLIFVLIIRTIFNFYPELAESVYRNGFYQVIRVLWDFGPGSIPIPWFPFFFASLFFVVLYHRQRIFSSQPFKKRLLRTLNVLGYLYSAFALVWGLNYTCPSLKDKMVYVSYITPDTTLLESYYTVKDTLTQMRDDLPPSVVTEVFIPENPQEIIRESVEKVLSEFDIKTDGKVRCKTISYKGWMRDMGISGIYFPYALESYVDGSQSTITHVFSTAHELSHGYGITDEGEANFVAYLALSNCNEPIFRYIAEIEHLSYLLVEIRDRNFDLYKALRADLPHWVLEDLNYIREKAHHSENNFAWFSDQINDFYLKSNGVDEGIGSYSQMVDLIRHYKSLNPAELE